MKNERYLRHIQLEEVGISGQEKLLASKVLVVGAGGLGCPVLQYLAASGVGTLGIVDPDVVSTSNLHRQILYTEKDVSQNKALCARQKLQQLNSEITIEAHPIALTAENCLELISGYDIVVDGTDNFVTRYLINDACILTGKPMVYGALYKFEGQVSVFNYNNGPTYRCLFPNPPQQGEVPNCSELGILGVLPGLIGTMQATEVLKIILNLGEVLSGRVLYVNTLDNRQRTIGLSRNDHEVDRIKQKGTPEPVETADCLFGNTISLNALSDDADILWVDVREAGELPKISAPNVIHLPLSAWENGIENLTNNKTKIFFCQSGTRSKKASQYAMEANIINCLSLKEGAPALERWIKALV